MSATFRKVRVIVALRDGTSRDVAGWALAESEWVVHREIGSKRWKVTHAASGWSAGPGTWPDRAGAERWARALHETVPKGKKWVRSDGRAAGVPASIKVRLLNAYHGLCT